MAQTDTVIPSSLVAPMPSIFIPRTDNPTPPPMPPAPAELSTWQKIDCWINDHPVGGLMGAAFLFLILKKGGAKK